MEIKSVRELATKLVEDFYKNQNASIFLNISKRNYDELIVSTDKILEHIRIEMLKYENEDGSEMTESQQEEVMECVVKELWGYGIIDELVHDSQISDIRINGHDNVHIKKYGRRYKATEEFENEEAYISFVTRLLERNRVNLGTANAVQTFTDESQPDFILRITALSGLLNDKGVPCITIRKIPKEKYTFADLDAAGMFSYKANKKVKTTGYRVFCKNQVLNDLFAKMINSRGLIFTGKGASGKTTLINAFVAKIPKDEAVMICQENREIFDNKHLNIISTHVVINGSDSKISYTLGDLTRAALLFDVDRIIVGEVKDGQEALGLSKASMTGHKCWTSVHGESCKMGIDKMADYISQATGYSLEESRKQLLGFEYVVHLNEYNVDEIVKIEDFDVKTGELIVKQVYPNGGVL